GIRVRASTDCNYSHFSGGVGFNQYCASGNISKNHSSDPTLSSTGALKGENQHLESNLSFCQARASTVSAVGIGVTPGGRESALQGIGSWDSLASNSADTLANGSSGTLASDAAVATLRLPQVWKAPVEALGRDSRARGKDGAALTSQGRNVNIPEEARCQQEDGGAQTVRTMTGGAPAHRANL
ncbi:unnamed protein product, partial [Discosporangium mesarthrocarpum]